MVTALVETFDDGMPTYRYHTVPRRPGARTYMLDGRERYADTGLDVDMPVGTHLLVAVVEDAEAYARDIEAQADAQLARWRWRDRPYHTDLRDQLYESAARVRAAGPCWEFRSEQFGLERGEPVLADIRRSHPHPGVRYELVPVDDVSSCPDCHYPTVLVAGTWRHHHHRFPVECTAAWPKREPEPEHVPAEGEEWWEISPSAGTMLCGYCHETCSWAEAVLGYSRPTGNHLLGVEMATGRLVVLAEATTMEGATDYLPHHCEQIPPEVAAQYAGDAQEIMARQ